MASHEMLSVCLSGIQEAEVLLAGVRKSLRKLHSGGGDAVDNRGETLHATANISEVTGPAEPPLTAFEYPQVETQRRQTMVDPVSTPQELQAPQWTTNARSRVVPSGVVGIRQQGDFLETQTFTDVKEKSAKLVSITAPHVLRLDAGACETATSDTTAGKMDAGQSEASRTQTWSHDSKVVRVTKSAKCKMVDQVVLEALREAGQKGEQLGTSHSVGSPQKGVMHSRSSISADFVYHSQDGFVAMLWSCVPILILHPESKYRVYWLAMSFLFIIFEAYATPFFLAFDVEIEGALAMVVNVINVYFIADVILSCFTGFVENNGSLVIEPIRIWSRYARTWLIPDIVVAFPWEWVAKETSSPQVLRNVRFFRFVRLTRLMRLVRLVKLKAMLDRLHAIIESNEALIFGIGVLRVLILLFGVTHWSACGWYVLGRSSSGSSWLDHELLSEIAKNEIMKRYVCALYFTLTTMTTVGYGDITPTNFHEVCFAFALLCVASVVFPGLMGVLMGLIGQLQSSRRLLQEKRLFLRRYLSWRNVPRRLSASICAHLLFIWETIEGYDEYEEQIKTLLPPVLSAELSYHIFGRILEAAPFLGWMHHEVLFVKDLAARVHTVFLVCGDTVFRMGMPNEQIYVLIEGQVFVSQSLTTSVGSSLTETKVVDDTSGQDLSIPRRKHDCVSIASIISTVIQKSSKTNDHESCSSSELCCDKQSKDGDSRFDMFDSNALSSATAMISDEDARKCRAVTRIQRAWKERAARNASATSHQACLGASADASNAHIASKGKHNPQSMTSKTVFAPSYLGESCLWVPLEEWDNGAPPPYLYSAVAQSRCELLHIHRSAVRSTIQRFPDLLQDRFEFFRKAVGDHMLGFLPNGTEETVTLRADFVNWAEMDLAMPEQEGNAMDQGRRNALLREVMLDSRRPLRDSECGRPASSGSTWALGLPRDSSRSCIGSFRK